MLNLIRVLTTIFFVFILSADHLCKAEEVISFDSPKVMNLSEYLFRHAQFPPQKYVPIKIDSLSLDSARFIIEKSELGRINPEIISYSEKYSRKGENMRIANDKETVSRTGKSLIIKPSSAPPITFKDWISSSDDDGGGFLYLGKLALNGFYRVEAFYQHDSPGSFFINSKNGRIIYTHNSTDTVALAPNGKRMVVLNDGLNPPFGLLVVNMILDNPKLELNCRCSTTHDSEKITPVFKGWHSGKYSDKFIWFDLVLISF